MYSDVQYISGTVVEANPDVLKRVEEGGGWEGDVRVVQGRWQDVLPQLGHLRR